MNIELYNLLKKCVDHTGLPVMHKELFLDTTEKYGKELFRKTLAAYITNEKPPYPLKEFNMEKVVTNFRKLQKADFTRYLSQPNNIMEKYDDNKYSYEEYGLGLIDGPSTFNYCADAFMNDLRMECGSYGLNLQFKDGMKVIIFGVHLGLFGEVLMINKN